MKFSVITINFNNKNGIKNTIESVIEQTLYNETEFIIIDGGSTDGSVDIIKEYSDKIGYWVSEPDKGIYNAMNKGIAQAHGDYFIFMNSGDCFYNCTVLKDISPFLTKDIVVGKTYYENGIHGFDKSEISLLDLCKITLPHQATFFRKKIFDDLLYDESYRIISDYKLYIEALITKNVSFLNTDITICRFEGNGISANSENAHGEKSEMALQDCIPERILKDYKNLLQLQDPIINMLIELKTKPKIQKFLYYLCKIALKITK